MITAKKFPNESQRLQIDEFSKQIGSDPSFVNMGEKLKLRGPDHAFYFKGEFYRAWYFPNFGNPWVTFWKDIR